MSRLRSKRVLLALGIFLAGVVGAALFHLYTRSMLLDGLRGTILFTDREGDNLTLFSIQADGTNRKRLFLNEDVTPFTDVGTINQNIVEPRWSDDGQRILFTAARGGGWKRMSIGDDGMDLRTEMDDPDLTNTPWSLLSRSDDLTVQDGDLFFVDPNGTQHKLFNTWLFVQDLTGSPAEASWDPSHRYAIFQYCRPLQRCGIYIADTVEGRVARLTDGQEPDWQ